LPMGGTGSTSTRPHGYREISPTQVWSAVTYAAESVGASTERGAEAYLRELGWREFSYHLLYHFP